MRLLKLEVEGFRSLKSLSWELDQLNVVVGAVGAGKSSVMRALGLIARSARGELEMQIQRRGGLGALAWDGQAERLRLRIKTSPIDAQRDIERDSLTYDLELGRVGERAFRVERELLGNYYRVETGERTEPLKLLERNPRHAVVFDEQQRALVSQEGVNEAESLLSLARGPFALNRLISAYQRELSRWQAAGELAADGRADVRRSAESRHDARLSDDGANLVSVLHTHYSRDRGFKATVHRAMDQAFGEDFEELVFPPAGTGRVEMRVRWRSLGREVPAAELPSGLLRFLYIVTLLAAPVAAPLIVIDEPEQGLQPTMIPVVAELAVEASARSQVVLLTQSPQLLDAFPAEKMSSAVIERSEGASRLRKLQGDALEDWLDVYSYGAAESAEAAAEES